MTRPPTPYGWRPNPSFGRRNPNHRTIPLKTNQVHDLVRKALSSPEEAKLELVRSICRESLYEFVKMAWPILEPSTPLVEGWYLREICRALQAVTEGRIRRLMVNVPPACSKSAVVNVYWPAWEWGPRGLSHYRYISASYELGLPIQHMGRTRDLVVSKWFQEHWPLEMKESQNEKMFYGNVNTGWRKASSVGGALTGYRGDRIIVDDPHDVKRAESEVERAAATRWWTQTLPTRLNHADKSAIILIMQRLHLQDLSGHVLENDIHNEWVKMILPMEYEEGRKCVIEHGGIKFKDPRTVNGELLWPERFSREAVDSMKHAMMAGGGPYAVAGQLQQRPIPQSGSMFARAAVSYCDPSEVPAQARRYRGWDLAASTDRRADYTVGIRIALFKGRIYIEDEIRLRGSPLAVKEALKAAATKDGKQCTISIPQDPGQAGMAQRADLAALLGGWDVHFSLESGDKEDRARPVSAQWEAGNVVIVRGQWNHDFLKEMEVFPEARKDRADALSRAYSLALTRDSSRLTVGLRPATIVERPFSSSSMDL